MPRRYVRKIDARRYKAYTDETLEECEKQLRNIIYREERSLAELRPEKNKETSVLPDFHPYLPTKKVSLCFVYV